MSRSSKPQRLRRPKARGLFPTRLGQWGGHDPPDPCVVAEEARMLADPAVSIVAVRAVRGVRAMGVVANPDGFIIEHEGLVHAWLSDVYSPRVLVVPEPLRRLMHAHRAIAIPMRTPLWKAGAIALPLRPGWGPLGRELAHLGAEFALRLQAADRQAQLWLVRMAAVRPRPARRSGGARRCIAASFPMLPTPARRPPRVRATLLG